ncbi:MAG: diaminopimelate epimerase [Eubacterium sp.]|nr:diaminopimelate epimerase [Eubacterium sp.]
MKFTKMHGCGNDYIYIDCFKETVTNESELAVKLSDRHFGIGGDGIILIKKGTAADFEMVMYNPDGTRAEMCGNAIRCVAKYVFDNGYTDKTSFSIESMGAVKYIDVTVENGEVVLARVDMGAPILKSADVPVNSDNEKVISEKITVAGREFNMTCVSMGNPHAVMFIEEHPSDFDLDFYGAKFECNTDVFPNRINAEFAKVIDRKNIEMRVFERGTGETLACGTGTCATVVAAILNGYADNDVTVHLIGGDLQIQWSGQEEDSVFMTGPAATVFTGEIHL